jgi:hypothetical protein
MSDKLSKTVLVDFAELRDAYEFANFGGSEYAAYVGLETGKVYFVTGQEDLDGELPGRWHRVERCLAAGPSGPGSTNMR